MWMECGVKSQHNLPAQTLPGDHRPLAPCPQEDTDPKEEPPSALFPGGAHRATTHSVPGYLGGLSSNFFCTS